MRILTAPHVAEDAVLEVLKSAFRSTAGGRPLPPQSVVPFPGGGDAITYPAVLPETGPGLFSMKVSPYLPQQDGPPIITAWTLLMSLETGEPLALVDSIRLTAERTAATSALAADALAAPDAAKAAIIGLGPLGLAHVRYLQRVRPNIAITGYSRSSTGEDPGFPLAASLDEALEDADVVMLCTSAAETVIDPRRLHPSAVVTSISTNAPGAREIPVDAVADMDVYVDDHACLSVATELREARAAGWDPNRCCGSLAEVLAGQAQSRNPDRVAFFRSIGLGLEDAAVAWAALEADSVQ